MRAAIHLHLFYPDVALELVDRVAALGRADIDVLATFVAPLEPEVDSALDRIPGRVRRLLVPNVGWDIGPLLHILPHISTDYDAVCHLHTKKGDSGFQQAWRDMAYAGTVADNDLVTRILGAFDERPDLMILGPELLYISAAAHQFRNAEILSALAPRMLAPMYPLADWGFFAGTFFWARPRLLERVAQVADFAADGGERDGTLSHALERLFGLAPVAEGGSVGLVSDDGTFRITPAPGNPSRQPIIETLALYHRRHDVEPPIEGEFAELIAVHNPLVHYIRHGREEDALDPNPSFSSRWYNRVHSDVAGAGMHPLHHYLLHGAAEGRSTGPEGASALRVAEATAAAGEGPRRFYRNFDIAGEAAFLLRMAHLPPDQDQAAAATRVSVIMPVYNREATIASAIRSVLAQTHDNWELIVVDDGSTDPTREMVQPFLADPRVRLVEGRHEGISAARNLGLSHATGDLIAYLDSDNRWNSWFLEVMTRFLASTGLEAAYSAISLRDDAAQLTGYRGAAFDWDACLEQNYIDLNAFCHRPALIEQVGGFDPKLRRMVDWDLILRIGKGREIGYAPFVGCDYMDSKFDAGRITTVEPAAFQRLVWTKNRYGLDVGTPEFLEKLRLVIGIKIHAPEEEKAAWGDWHFADSLAAAIRRLGHDAHVDFRGQWRHRPMSKEDVAIVLRGLEGYEPRPGQLAFLWNISHPDQVPYEEYDAFTRVYVASRSFAEFLRPLIRPPVAVLPQATDPERFHPLKRNGEGQAVIFCGNSRGVERDIVRWAIEADRLPAIYGGGWEELVPPWLVKGANVDNRQLGALYAGAGAVLNDHWPSMAAFGLISNRLFDIVAAGGKAVSDRVPSITSLFGSAVAQVSGPEELREAVDRWRDTAAPLEASQAIREHHSFDARARRLVADAYEILGLEPPFAVPAEEAPRLPTVTPARPRLRVHLIVPHGPHGPQSSAYIRLVAPLTDESVEGRVAFTLGRAEDGVPACDVCIVQRAAMPSVEAVDALQNRLEELGARLVVDVDDAFVAIGPEHPEAAIYRPLNAALEHVIAASTEAWFSTQRLAELYAHVAPRGVVIRNGIDPRIWRDWRRARPEPLARSHVRMLYMGTSTHGPDFALIRPALERLASERPGRFDVTLVGVAQDVEPATWLFRHSPPGHAISYPRFVRWLREQGPFDIGLAPLTDTTFNSAKSDIKLLDYAALGLVPVVSDCPAYRVDPALSEQAVLAQDWHAALSEVLDDRDSARRRAAAAHAHVWSERGVAEIARMMVERLEVLR